MARAPITWKNIDAPDFTRAAQIQELANRRIDKGFESARGVIDTLGQHQEQVQQRNSDDFRSRLFQQYSNPEELRAAQASGEFEALRQRYQNNGGLDSSQTNRAAMNSLIGSEQQQVNQDQTYNDGRKQVAVSGLMEQIDLAALEGDEAKLKQYRNSPVADAGIKAGVDGQLETIYRSGVRNKRLESYQELKGQAKTQQGLQGAIEKKWGINMATLANDPAALMKIAKQDNGEDVLSDLLEYSRENPGVQMPTANLLYEGFYEGNIARGLTPVKAKQAADEMVGQAQQDSAVPTAISNEHKLNLASFDNQYLDNPAVQQRVKNPAGINLAQALEGKDMSNLTGKQQDGLDVLIGQASDGIIPAGSSLGNKVDWPLTTELVGYIVNSTKSSDSAFWDFLSPGTRNAQERLAEVMERGGLTEDTLKGYESWRLGRTKMDEDYERQNYPGMGVAPNLGEQNIRAALQQSQVPPSTQAPPQAVTATPLEAKTSSLEADLHKAYEAGDVTKIDKLMGEYEKVKGTARQQEHQQNMEKLDQAIALTEQQIQEASNTDPAMAQHLRIRLEAQLQSKRDMQYVLQGQ